MPGAQRLEQSVSSFGTGVLDVVSHHMDAGNQAQALQEQQLFLPIEPSLQPQHFQIFT